ncbi:hypothetical protein GGS20DRAFT_536084 [Poronia punctata]|nr:hypothetical protein GGS20DRAFT_536084 [Poronia punctata]
MTDFPLPFVTISSRQSTDDSEDSTYGSSLGDSRIPAATHDTSRVNYHVKRLPDFAKALQDSAARAFPNHGSSQRYKRVYALLLHWDCDDLFVLPELTDLDMCFRQDYNFESQIFTIPSRGNPQLDLTSKIVNMIQEHDSSDTLLIVYYGGHARIDEARQSTWCASRSPQSPTLQWSAIQTLLETSRSDSLILLDCCAGAASATFPRGRSITETVSASGWDAIAPDPGRYSFTSTLLEVLQEWRHKTFSVAMLHAEVLARLKHPRPERRNGAPFETRTTPVHFMMTANHKAPSIEIRRLSGDVLALPPSEPISGFGSARSSIIESRDSHNDFVGSEPTEPTEPTESVPHVMISLALEEEQNLDINDWEQWLSSIPALARYVKVQGVFKSHSTLLLLSLPVMVWDMLPDHRACNFVAFIRSNNLVGRDKEQGQNRQQSAWASTLTSTSTKAARSFGEDMDSDRISVGTSTTAYTSEPSETPGTASWFSMAPIYEQMADLKLKSPTAHPEAVPPIKSPTAGDTDMLAFLSSATQPPQPPSKSNYGRPGSSTFVPRFLDTARAPQSSSRASDQPPPPPPNRPALPSHVEKRLEEYFVSNPSPTVAVKEFLASSLRIEIAEIDAWFRHRREQQEVSNRLQSLQMDDQSPDPASKDGARMILPAHLNKLLEIFPTGQVLIIDLRPQDSYQRSHIHGAINFRAPALFVSHASMGMIEKCLPDEASRSSFAKWDTTKCIVFYDSVLHYPWEAPAAEALFQKFRSKHWPGQCFVLKGHYREFSQSFDKYIVGVNQSEEATKYLASLQDVSWEKSKDEDESQRYEEWLKLLDGEDRVNTVEPPEAAKVARLKVTLQQQAVLEAEFERAFSHLHRQAQARKPDDNWSVKAPIVEHLERGLAKMQGEAGTVTPQAADGIRDTKHGTRPPSAILPAYTRYPDSSPSQSEPARTQSDQEHQNVWQGAETHLHDPSSSSSTSKDKDKALDDMSPGTSSIERRGRSSSGGGKSLFTRIMRSGRPDPQSR